MIDVQHEGPPDAATDGGDGPEAPWVETPAGGWFFVNAILAAPIFMALYPWALRWALRAAGILDRPSRILDPVPAVADHFIPVLGWLSIPAAWLVIRNLRMVEKVWARRLLWVFLMAHAGTLAYTVSRFVG